MQIFKNIEIIDLCLFLTKSKTLVIPDVHIGYEEALNKQGILIPRTQFKEIMINIEKIIKEVIFRFNSINQIIILGDLKHEFGRISETEWRQTLRFLDFLSKFCNNIILIKGNHDTILGPIAKKRNLEIVDNCLVDDILFVHGDKIPTEISKQTKTIIIGHEHPAISLKQGPRVEKYKCFLKGNWIMNKKIISKLEKYAFKEQRIYNLIVMPSFNPLIEGTDILKEELLNPLLKQADIGKLDVFIVGDNVYNFGKIKEIVKHMK
ncbi:metallophosphoesterase [Candidatus Woesearchaeota archaeon]|nr:metallophosphoesterase [Candidatus Woesearchaeota archaeon]